MSNFDTAINYVLSNEGGFVDNGNDKGNVTNFGISLNFLKRLNEETLHEYGISSSPSDITSEDIENINRDQATLIYKESFWNPINIDKINSSIISTYLLDMVVNHGVSQAVKLVQRGICAIHRIRDILSEDGNLGPRTLGYINSSDEKELLSVLIALRVSFYRLIVQINPTQKEFLNGWIARAYSIGLISSSR